MRLQCNACAATYVDVLPDGMQYFHACAPLSAPELRAALDAGVVTLSPTQATQLAALDETALTPTPAGVTAPTSDAFLARLTVERRNKRDENVVTTKQNDGTIAVGIKSPGDGVTVLEP